MNNKSYFLYLFVFLIIFGCSKKDNEVVTVKEKNLENQMIEIYNEGIKEFEKGDVIYAGKKFSEAELLFLKKKI